MVRAAITATSIFVTSTTSYAASSDAERLNILGIRTGDPATEVIALIKTKTPPLTDSLKFQHFYRDVLTGNDVPVPNSEYLGFAAINVTPFSSDVGNLQVHFSPEPGKERVVAVTRMVSFPKTPLLESEFIDSLVKKYGPPVFDGNNPAHIVAWYAPVTARVARAAQLGLPTGVGCAGPSILQFAPGQSEQIQPFVMKFGQGAVRGKIAENCGNINLQFTLSLNPEDKQPMKPFGQRLLNGFEAKLIDVSLMEASYQGAVAMIAAAEQAHRQQAAEKAAGRKAPEL